MGLSLPLIAGPSTLLAQPAPPAASLEARIDGLLQGMSRQEKLEQRFYQTDGNARLAAPLNRRRF